MITFVLRFGNELPCVSVHLLLQNGKSYFLYEVSGIQYLVKFKKGFGADRFFHPVHSLRLKNSSYGSFWCYFESDVTGSNT